LSPQKENGYTPIANEILEAMAQIKLSPTQYRILFIVWRYTYGFNRKEHELSLSFLAKATRCDKRNIQRDLKNLEERKIIIQQIKSGAYRKIKFNKYYKQWVGDIDIGEITNIGENNNTTIGETNNTNIGEIANQERNNINTNLNTNIIYLSPDEEELINVLSSIKGYPLDREKEIEMFKRLRERYLDIDILSVVKEWAISKIDKPISKKDNPRSQINTWCGNSKKWGKNLKEGANGSSRQGKQTSKYDKSKWLG